MLNVTAPFVVPDPRCERALDNTILSAVAHARSATARESARSVGVSLRSVQRVLERLVEEGACVVERSGRHVRYRVEDTTFSEPTRNFG